MPLSTFEDVLIEGSHPFYGDVTAIPYAHLTVSAKNDEIPVLEGHVANHDVTIELKYKVPGEGEMRTDVFPFGRGTQNSVFSLNEGLEYFVMEVGRLSNSGEKIFQRIKMKFNGYINSYTFNMLATCYGLLLFMNTEDIATSGARGV